MKGRTRPLRVDLGDQALQRETKMTVSRISLFSGADALLQVTATIRTGLGVVRVRGVCKTCYWSNSNSERNLNQGVT